MFFQIVYIVLQNTAITCNLTHLQKQSKQAKIALNQNGFNAMAI